MSAGGVVASCGVAFLALIVIDAIRTKSITRLLWQLVVWLVVTAWAFAYFQASTGRIPFGDDNTRVIAIAVIFVATLFGIAAHYFFYLEKPNDFGWLNFLKPLLITPIVVTPLIGSMQHNTTIETMQLVMLGLLAFQNGFFWRVVLGKAKKDVVGQTQK